MGNFKGVLAATYYRTYDVIPVLNGFIGAIIEYGGAWDDRDDINSDTSIASFGTFVGAETPIGMFQLGVAFTNEGDSTFFSRIGRVF